MVPSVSNLRLRNNNLRSTVHSGPYCISYLITLSHRILVTYGLLRYFWNPFSSSETELSFSGTLFSSYSWPETSFSWPETSFSWPGTSFHHQCFASNNLEESTPKLSFFEETLKICDLGFYFSDFFGGFNFRYNFEYNYNIINIFELFNK